MKFNYILLGIVILFIGLSLIKGSSREGQVDFKKFKLEGDVMRKLGDGCCRFKNWKEGAKNLGQRTAAECLNLCTKNPKCWAADYNNPVRDKYTCYNFEANKEPQDLHLECDKKTKCFKKVLTGSAICEVPEACPMPKKIKPRKEMVANEEFEDQNIHELEMLDQIKKGLREIVGLQKPPNPCADDPNACRPGALTEDQFADFLKTQANLAKQTCGEAAPADKCKISAKEDDPSKKLTEEEIQNVLKNRCKVIAKENEVDPPNLKKCKYPFKNCTPSGCVNGKCPKKGADCNYKCASTCCCFDNQCKKKTPKQPPKLPPKPAPQGVWEVVPHKHSGPADGVEMYRELSTPAFSAKHQRVAKDIPKYSSLFG